MRYRDDEPSDADLQTGGLRDCGYQHAVITASAQPLTIRISALWEHK